MIRHRNSAPGVNRTVFGEGILFLFFAQSVFGFSKILILLLRPQSLVILVNRNRPTSKDCIYIHLYKLLKRKKYEMSTLYLFGYFDNGDFHRLCQSANNASVLLSLYL